MSGDQSTDPAHRRFVVGVGASAGGLEAITALVSKLPADFGAPIVVVQHLSPTHRSMLVDLLGRATTLTVSEAFDGAELSPGVVYVAPASHHLAIERGRFRRIDTAPRVAPMPSVNTFFESLAEDCGADAIAVVLSGTGSDGAAGVHAIKGRGGLVFAQDPASAKYDGMPRAAIVTGCVDRVASAEAIARELAQIVLTEDTALSDDDDRGWSSPVRDLLDILRQRTGSDFSGYKESTVLRRIERRLRATTCPDVRSYVDLVRGDPDELDNLFGDLLINVTAFFRDGPAFRRLRDAIAELPGAQDPARPLRVWVPGCATGEEAYSLAMLFADVHRSAFEAGRIKVFATDLDNEALAVARRGIYRASTVSTIDPAFAERFLVAQGDDFQITKPLRDLVVFSRHDVTRDPPFLRIDLVSCRNLLIYLNADLQSRVISSFRYALNDEGLLFLGRSESVANSDPCFEPANRSARIFRARPGTRAALDPGKLVVTPVQPRIAAPTRRSADFVELAAQRYTPPGLLLNGRLEIEHISGDCAAFLRLGEGKPSLAAVDLIDPVYRAELQSLLVKAGRGAEVARGRRHLLELPEGHRTLQIAVHRLDGDHDGWFLVAFETAEAPSVPVTARETSSAREAELEHELHFTREQLQTMIEELETSNEELQSLNEELQSTNEELETANEELQTSNEELQSTNEELETANDELNLRTQELAHANLELTSIHRSMDSAVVVIDNERKVVHANELARRLFFGIQVTPDIVEIATALGEDDLFEALEGIRSGRRVSERRVRLGGRRFELRVLPWTSADGRMLGVVLELHDRTAVFEAEEALRRSREELYAFVENSVGIITIKDARGTYQHVNPAFADLFDLDRDAVVGLTDDQLLPGSVAALFRQRELDVVGRREPIESEDVLNLPDGEVVLLTMRFPLLDEHGRVLSVFTHGVDITARYRAEATSMAQQLLLRGVLDSTGANIAVLDRTGRIVEVNQAWVEFGRANGMVLSASDWVGMNYLEICRADAATSPDARHAADLIDDVLAGRRGTGLLEYPCHSPWEERWFWMHVTPFRGDRGGVVVSHTNMTERHKAEDELRLVAAVFENTNEGVVILDGLGRVLTANRVAGSLLDPRSEGIEGRSWRRLGVETDQPMGFARQVRATGRWQGEATFSRNGKRRALLLHVAAVRDGFGRVRRYVATFADITRMKEAERNLQLLAFHDPLTGLQNRAHFNETIGQMLSLARRHQRPLAVLYLDLDRFKLINDGLGHDVGDELLIVAARRLLRSVRSSDLVVRLGGDEFVVVLEDLRHREDAAHAAAKIVAALDEPYLVKGQRVHCGVSVGIALFPDDGTESTELLKNADAAMFRAKERGGSGYRYFSEEMHRHAKRRLWLETNLRDALRKREFTVQYEPQYSTLTGELRSCEALLRWRHPLAGTILPDEFIPVAEEMGEIVPIGEWVLRVACQTASELRRAFPAFSKMSVNVSARQLRDPGFANVVAGVLGDYDLPAECLELELTESSLVEYRNAAETLGVLRALGVSIAVDDFGTGHASLSYLQRLPVDTLKVDRSFVAEIEHDENQAAIVRSILALARIMGLDVVAEGVETEGQLDLLRRWHCPNIQGWITGTPATRGALPARLDPPQVLVLP